MLIDGLFKVIEHFEAMSPWAKVGDDLRRLIFAYLGT
jgi:hypothetical protein